MTVKRRAVLGGLVAASLPLGAPRAQVAPAARVLDAATGWKVEYDAFEAPSARRAVVFLHGKNGSPRTPNMRAFAEKLAAAGNTVYLPVMPWSRAWNGTVADGHAALDALVAAAASAGRRVFVGGLSLGATFAMTWRPGDPPSALAGKAFVNPGGLIDLIPPQSPFWTRIRPEVERAKALAAAGKAKEKTEFGGTNVSGAASIEERYATTPEVYLSFHDPERFPSIRSSLAATRVPVFWSAGKADPTANAKRRTFEMLPRNAASVYVEPEGDHNSAFLPAADPLLAWLDANFRV